MFILVYFLVLVIIGGFVCFVALSFFNFYFKIFILFNFYFIILFYFIYLF